MNFFRSCFPAKRILFAFTFLTGLFAFTSSVAAQTCYTGDDMDAATKSALLTTGKNFFDSAAKGDLATLRQNAIASLASNFSGIENVVGENRSNFAGAQGVPRSPFLLKTQGAAAQNQEFLCGVFTANGQTESSAIFQIPNLPPGSYGIVTLDVTTAKQAYMVTFVLQQEGAAWKLGGFYVRNSQVLGHDANWFASQARTFKGKSQNHSAYLYFLQARYLLVPVDFMSTKATDRLYDEAQTVKPVDLPPTSLPAANGKSYKLTTMFPLAVGTDLDLVVKFESTDVSNTTQAYQDNMAVMKALVAKYPEYRDAFNGVVARAVEPSGRDYGTMLAMKDIK